MRIIDSHVHIGHLDAIPEAYKMGIARTMSMLMKRKLNVDFTVDYVYNNVINEMFNDPDGNKYIGIMDNAGIEKAVVFGSDFGQEIGDPKIHPFEVNKMIADAARNNPDRLVALAIVDPRRPGALKHVEKCIEEWGMKGLKMHPAAGFYPTDEVLYPFYERCANWGVPIVFHSGAQPAAPVRLDPQRPLFIAEAATKFPNTKMIIAHVAMDLWNEAVMYGKLIPNIYFDVSVHQNRYVEGSEKFYQWLRHLIDQCGAEKIMWATDHPLPSAILSPDLWVRVFTERQIDITFSDREIEMIMGGTANQVFGI